ncbi:MAG: ATP-dependent DNA helicase UvrD2, partial [Acidimicrobiales bacterium]|nr:ATP-dependent DNA helicase UvrD2 [Acidimicrobiales bacterium]
GATELQVGPGAPPVAPGEPSAIDVLAGCWAARRRFIARWHGPAGGPDLLDGPDERDERPAWELGVEFEFAGDRLATLLRLQAVDARHPAGARYRPAELAVARGGTAAPPDGPGEVLLADGRAAVLDGGPLTPQSVPGTVVLPAALVELGELRPLGEATTSASLAADQLAAVSHVGNGARIIAPAGSGKTRVLTERARLLLSGRRLPPSLLTLVAFNVRAAEEMRSRTTDLPALHIRTLNSLGLAIVNGSGPFLARADGRRLTTIDETDVRRVLEGLVRFPRRAGTDPAAPWLEALAAVRLGLRSPAAVEDDFGGDVDGLAEVMPRYREELARRGALDYDEQIVAAIERLAREPAARRRAQQVCRVLLVDEFQDLAPAHLLLVRLLSAPTYDCFGVGDDDQTIYGYAGASPDWLVRFDRWFPGAADHPLQTNYRCPPEVVTAASNLLTRNRHRVPKQIHAAPGREPRAGALVVRRSADVAQDTCSEVERLVASGVAPADIAVLTRVNVTLLPVQLRLAAAGIATTAPVDAQLLTRSGARAALAWVSLAAAGRGSARGAAVALPSGLLGDAARRPPRGLSPKLLEWMNEQRSIEGLRRLAGRLSSAKDSDKVERFAADVEFMMGLARDGADTAAVLRAVADRIGLGAAMETLDRSRGAVDRSAHGDDLAALEAVAHLHPDPSGFGAWLRRQLTNARVPAADGVQLATVHRVKGREWPHVLVHDASDALLPHRLATDVEEERRVFHVAITRGSVSVQVLAPADRPSPFLDELDRAGVPTAMPSSTVPSGTGGGSPVVSAGRRARPAGATAGAGGPAHQPTVEALKAWRRDRARADGVPAYVILPDKAIEDIAVRQPSSLAELARCHGIGPTKLDRYGDEVLAAVDAAR